MPTIEIPGEYTTVLFGAFHHVHSSNPRYKLNTQAGRFETINEEVDPKPFCYLNENGEPEWTNIAAVNDPDAHSVILTFDQDGQVTAIREGTLVGASANSDA